MSKICPFYRNKQVFDDFNQLIEAFGGKPMTMEEFLSSDLRNLRSGLDYSSMEAAYKIWNLNNGNMLEYTQDGERSILFDQLLKQHNGDRNAAIKAKAAMYSNKYRDNVLNWIDEDGNLLLRNSEDTDINGEPILKPSKARSLKKRKTIRFKLVNVLESFGEALGQKLLSGEAVSSKELILKFGEISAFNFIEGAIAKIIGMHDIPVKLIALPNGKLMANFTDSNGQTFIAIDPTLITSVSNNYLATKLTHEIIHSLTVNAISSPKTEIEKKFSRLNNKLYSIFDKHFPSWKYNRYDKTGRHYILANEKEFAAVFATDQEARNMLYNAAREMDNNQNELLKLLKSFVNTFSKLIVNKEVFNTNEGLLKQYESLFNAYLINKDLIRKGDINIKATYDAIYNDKSNVALAGDLYAEMRENLNFSLDNFDVNYVVNFEDESKPAKNNQENAVDALQKMSESIVAALKRRIGGLRNSSYLSPAAMSRGEETLNIQIKQFQSETTNTFFAVSSLISQLAPQLKNDIDEVRKFINPDGSYKSTDAGMYMEQRHNNFGTYLNILNSMEDTFKNGNTASYMMLLVLNDPLLLQQSFNKDFQSLMRNILVCKLWAEEGVRIMNSVRLQNVKKILSKIGEETHSPSMLKYLENLEVIGYDTSWFMMQVGSLDGAKDEALRALVHLVNEANSEVETEVNKKTVELLELQKNLKFGESQLDLYERNKKGKFTGYLIRALNYGQFYEDYNEFMRNLNLQFGLDVSNRKAPENFEQRVEWNRAKNKWLSLHCERRFLSEYYDILAGLSYEAQQARNNIQTNISAIKNKVKHNDGYYYYSELSQEDFNVLQDLYALKRQLTSEYNINGDLKTGEDLAIARELKALNEKLFPKSERKALDKTSKSYNAWKNARLKVIDECGGIDKYRAASDDFNWDKLNEWDKRNSKYQLKTDDSGEALLYNRINEVFEQATKGLEIIYEIDGDGGLTYETNAKKIKDLLSPYRDRSTGELNPKYIPPAVMAKVKALDVEQSKIIRKAKAQNSKLNALTRIKAKIRQEYSKQVPTQLYLDMRKQAILRDIDHPGALAEFDRNNGRYYVDYETNETIYELHRWFLKTVPTLKYELEFMELAPGDGFMDYDESNKWINPAFNEEENHYFIPKKSLYKNDKFSKIEKSKTLKALYDATLNTMKESNGHYINRPFHDNFLLPQISGSLYTYLKSKDPKWSSVTEIMLDAIKNLGIREEIRSMYGADPTSIFDNSDDLGEIIKNGLSVDVSGKMADNRDLRLIPQFYSTKMENPEIISADLVGILCTYYSTAMNYKTKSRIKDVCETIVDQLEDRTILTNQRGKDGSKFRLKSGAESNTYQAAKKFLDMNLYGIRQEKELIGSVEFSRPGVLLKTFTTAINLGMSISVAAKGFLAGLHAHIMNGLTGYRYDYKDCLAGSMFVTEHLLKNVVGAQYIANNLSNDKLMLLAEYFNVAELGSKKYKNTNRNRLINAVNNNWCFGMLSASDFILKTTIMSTVLNSYRYYNGEFCTWEDVLINNYNKSKDEVKKLREQFNDSTKMIDIFEAENFKLKIKDKKMEEAFHKVENIVRERSNKTSADADGVATSTQKAAITSYTLGGLLLQHRQYLPKMLQNRFGEMVWDMDMQEYVNGQFRIAGQVAKIYAMGAFDLARGKEKFNVKSSNLGKGLLFGAALGTLIPILSPEVGILIGAGIGALGSLGSSEQLGLYMNDDYNSKREYAQHLYKNLQLKKTLIEIGIYNVVLKPLIALLCSAADDKERRKNLMLQLAAYIARGAEWELYNPYRFDDILNNVRSAFAATASLDAVGGLSAAMSTVSQMYTRESLFNTLLGSVSDVEERDDTVKSGVYKGWTKGQRALLKMTPFHNLYEQLEDPYKKRIYFENQIMKLNE